MASKLGRCRTHHALFTARTQDSWLYRTHLTSLQLGIKVLIPLESNRHGLFQRLDR
jgi:hypothetical protein